MDDPLATFRLAAGDELRMLDLGGPLGLIAVDAQSGHVACVELELAEAVVVARSILRTASVRNHPAGRSVRPGPFQVIDGGRLDAS